MIRLAMIKDEVVENICIWDGVSRFEIEGYEFVEIKDNFCDIGMKYQKGEFIYVEDESNYEK